MNKCEFCNANIQENNLCNLCAQLEQEEEIIKIDGEWHIKEEENSERFFEQDKKYFKKNFMTIKERKLYDILRSILNEKYIIVPQASLQSIIDTNKYGRNHSLFRQLDFLIIDYETLNPLLAIELNGGEHYYNMYNIKRDSCVKRILKNINLYILIIKQNEFENMSKSKVTKIIKEIIRHIQKGTTLKHQNQETFQFINNKTKN